VPNHPQVHCPDCRSAVAGFRSLKDVLSAIAHGAFRNIELLADLFVGALADASLIFVRSAARMRFPFLIAWGTKAWFICAELNWRDPVCRPSI
jgi:hypothetical protein